MEEVPPQGMEEAPPQGMEELAPQGSCTSPQPDARGRSRVNGVGNDPRPPRQIPRAIDRSLGRGGGAGAMGRCREPTGGLIPGGRTKKKRM